MSVTEDVVLNSYVSAIGFLTQAIELCEGDIDPFSNVQVVDRVQRANTITEILLRSVKDNHPVSADLKSMLRQVLYRLREHSVANLKVARKWLVELHRVFEKTME